MDNTSAYSNLFLENSLLLNNLQGGIVYSDFDPPFILRYVTEGMAQLSGYTQEELMGMGQMDLVCDEDKALLTYEVGRQFALGDTFDIEYRLRRKDGSPIYVLDRAKIVTHDDGQKYIHCLMTDISELKEMEQELRLSQEKYKLAVQQSGNVILEYNPVSQSLTFSENYARQFDAQAPVGTLQQISETGWVSLEDSTMLLEAFQQSLKGKHLQPFELRVLHGCGRYVWCNLSLAPISHANDHIYAVIGCLKNVDAEKHQLEHLTELSQKDGLTGVYNRITMENIVERHLQSESNAGLPALVVVDVDFFKQINDLYGHARGDEVLIRLTNAMRDALPENAFLGRLGGDEFLIFVSNLQGEEAVPAFAQSIIDGVHAAFVRYSVSLTISMGIAFAKGSATTFQELYKRADEALYLRKEKGRNGYCIHGKSS